MKTRAYAFLLSLGIALLASISPIHSQTLRVDLNGQSGPNETGFTSWNFGSGFSGALNENNSLAFGGATDGTVEVNISTTTTAGSRNYGLDNLDQSGGSIAIPNVWADLVFWNNNTGGSLTLTLDDLSAGVYQFTSYSYADNIAGNPGTGDSGIADVSLDTGAGFLDTGLNVTLGANADPDLTTADLETNSTVSFQFTVANDNDQIQIRYDGLAGNGGDSFGINGFVIESAGPDTTAPTVLALNPADNSSDVVASSNLTITFDEPIQTGTGDITLVETGVGPVATYAVTSAPELTFGADSITINPASDLSPATAYHVFADSGIVTDLSSNAFAGISDATTWNFTTDGTAPSVASLSPANGADFVDTGASLVLTFDEDVQAGPGNIFLKLLSDDSTVESWAVTSGSVTISENQVIVTRSVLLGFETTYYVEVDATAFDDLSGNSFAGINGNSTWVFTTESAALAGATQVQTTTDGAGTALQAGWILLDGNRNAASITGSVFGTTASVFAETGTAFGRSNGADGGDYLSVDHVDGSLDNLLSGGRLTNNGTDLVLTLSGLADGNYQIRTYNHSMYLSQTNGKFLYDVLLTDANGTGVVVHDDISNSAGTPVTTAEIAAPVTEFTVSGGNDVTIAFSPSWAVTDSSSADTAFNVIGGGDQMTLNGFEVAFLGGGVTSTPYTTWAASNGLTEGVNDGQGTDADLGGKNNLYEFGLGGNPLNGNDDGSLLHIYSKDEGGSTAIDGVLTILVRSGASFSASGNDQTATIDGITYTVAADNTIPLDSGAAVNPATLETTGLPAAPGGYEYVSFYIEGNEGYFQVTVSPAAP